MKEWNEEKNKFIVISKEYEKKIQSLHWEIQNVEKRYGNDEWSAREMKEKLRNTIFLLEKNKKTPYFARIDFKEEGGVKEVCYLGKIGIQNENLENVLIDWRAPIASLYYDHSVGEASYQSPKGEIKGTFSLKRQYEFEDGKLSLYRDIDLAANDDILKPYLSTDAGSRLKNIVASIQEEQNAIIRKSFFQNMIIQGVAGSGKTTVALHRIAYLVYNYENIAASKQYLLIGPNSFFVNYISSVLPDLDVYDVIQKDFVTFSKQFCKEEYTILSGSTKDSSYKVSLSCRRDIDLFLENYVMDKLKDTSLMIKDFPLLEKGFIYETWNSITGAGSSIISTRIEKCHTLLTRYVKQNELLLLEKAEKVFLQMLDHNTHPNLGKEYTYVQERIERGLQTEIRHILNTLKQKPSTLYRKFLKEKGLACKQGNTFYIEDLGALLHLRYRLDGSGFYENYKCTMIDEAQDYGAFHFFALREILSMSRFTILGDLAQSLYPERSIGAWSEVERVFDGKITTFTLAKSYRTTIEIMTEANKINRHLHLKEALPVIRHGSAVVYKREKEYENTILTLLSELTKRHKTIAIIHKNKEYIRHLYETLLQSPFSITHIHEDSMEYNGGICLLTSTLSKGLEFDAVIILDGDDKHFCPEDTLDMKLLYVSMTRALHELYVLYNKEVCSVLK